MLNFPIKRASESKTPNTFTCLTSSEDGMTSTTITTILMASIKIRPVMKMTTLRKRSLRMTWIKMTMIIMRMSMGEILTLTRMTIKMISIIRATNIPRLLNLLLITSSISASIHWKLHLESILTICQRKLPNNKPLNITNPRSERELLTWSW